MQIKTTTIFLIILGILIVGVLGFSMFRQSPSGVVNNPVNNVSMIDGKQIIAIEAKGGYSPRVTTAKANTPTVIMVNTQNTFDCSSAIMMPSLNYQANLPPSGQTAIEVPPQEAGTSLKGLCSMGMYSFSINFN